MTFDDYQEKAITTAVYPSYNALPYLALGICGEAGEVAEMLKKHLRGDKDLDQEAFVKELGDVLWYLAMLSWELGVDLETVAAANLDKLQSRKERGVLKGNGNDR